eukprot:4547387-Prymnesium_polylepis.1
MVASPSASRAQARQVPTSLVGGRPGEEEGTTRRLGTRGRSATPPLGAEPRRRTRETATRGYHVAERLAR